MQVDYRGVYIDATWHPIQESERSFSTENPFSGDSVLRVHPADLEHVDLAVESAHSAFLKWRKLAHQERSEYLGRL